MELSKQVCSRELAEKMKELGFPINSHFFWQKCENNDEEDKEYGEWYVVDKGELYFKNYGKELSAYSVAELGEMMPTIRGFSYMTDCGVECDTEGVGVVIEKYGGKWHCNFNEMSQEDYDVEKTMPEDEDGNREIGFEAESMADALGLMLLHLIQNGFINISDIKI